MLTAKPSASVWVAVALGAIAATAHAESRIEVGGYVGGSWATQLMTGDCPPNDGECSTASLPGGGTFGVSVGGYVRLPLSPSLEIEANLMYAQKGFKGSRARIHYLEAPILVRVDPYRDQSQTRLFGYGGLAPALRLWCHEQGTRFDNATYQAVPYSDACGNWTFYPQAPNRFDIGAVVGLGAGWRQSFGTLEIQLRFVHGLLPSGAWGGGHNEAFSLLAGFGRTL